MQLGLRSTPALVANIESLKQSNKKFAVRSPGPGVIGIGAHDDEPHAARSFATVLRVSRPGGAARRLPRPAGGGQVRRQKGLAVVPRRMRRVPDLRRPPVGEGIHTAAEHGRSARQAVQLKDEFHSHALPPHHTAVACCIMPRPPTSKLRSAAHKPFECLPRSRGPFRAHEERAGHHARIPSPTNRPSRQASSFERVRHVPRRTQPSLFLAPPGPRSPHPTGRRAC